MATFKDIARVTARGRDLPDISEGELKTNAWLVHQLILSKAQQGNYRRISFEGIPGLEWIGYAASAMRDLWPAIPSRREDDSPAQLAVRAVSRYLTSTKNMVCLDHGPDRQSRWFVREEWNDSPPAGGLRSTRRELRVTPQEAGEDREPAPVEMEYECPHCESRFASKHRRSAHIFTFAKHESLQEWLIKALGELPVPASPVQVHNYLEPLGFLGSGSFVGQGLKEFSEDPDSPIVMAVVPGRTVASYTLRSRLGDLPKFKESFCREPNCGAGPFTTSYYRAAHEDKEHPNSINRPCPCLVDTRACIRSFYEIEGLRQHLRRTHRILADHPTYGSLIARAGDAASKHVVRIVAQPWKNSQDLQTSSPSPSISLTEDENDSDALPDRTESQATPVITTSLTRDDIHRAIDNLLAEDDRLRLENEQLRSERDELREKLEKMGGLVKLAELIRELKLPD